MKFPRLAPLSLLCACLLTNTVFSIDAQARRAVAPLYNSTESRVRWGERNRQFGNLWLSRWQNPEKAARGILPFALNKVEQNADLRERAVVALGRIESPIAQKPLETLLAERLKQQSQLIESLKRQPQSRTPIWFSAPELQISTWSLKFALARIKSRNMKGTNRLDFVARSLGTTWPAIREQGRSWKRKLVDPKQRMSVYDYLRGPTSPRLTLEEFAQLLHDMGQKGENVKALGALDLLVWPSEKTASGGLSALYDPPQTVILTASMTRQQAIDFWLKRALPPKKNGAPRAGSFSPQAFLDLGPSANKQLDATLRELLERAKQNPRLGEGIEEIGPRTLFEAVAASGDLSFVPLLQDWIALKHGTLSYYAKRSWDGLKSGEGARILPRPRLYFSVGD